MIDAYLDESGIHDGAAVCVIAGYFAGRGKWKRFEDDWRQLLADFRVPMERFHAKNILPQCKGWFRDGWAGDHQGFLESIASTIAQHDKIAPISGGIIVPDFMSFPLDERRYLTGATIKRGKLIRSGCPNKPYFVPFQKVAIQICDYAPRGGKAHFFFGLDRNFAGYATDLFAQIKDSELQSEELGAWGWKKRLGDPSFPLAKETPQLQIADFLVNLTYNEMLVAGENVGTVPPSQLLAKCIQNRRSDDDFFFINKENINASLRNSAALSQFLRELHAVAASDHDTGVRGKTIPKQNEG